MGHPQLDVLNRKSTKCNCCIDRIKDNKKPACVNTCVGDALTFGKRSAIYAMAEERLAARKLKENFATDFHR